MAVPRENSLQSHMLAIKNDERVFENAFQAISRMILDSEIEKVVVNGKTTYDFKIFRQGKKHIVGMYDEINSFVAFVKDAAEGGSSAEMAYVLVGEPGNGKTYFVEYVSRLYRQFLSIPRNRKYTFKFKNLDKIGSYGKITTIESQTYEDPVVLAMNLHEGEAESRKHFASKFGLSDEQIAACYHNHRPLGACTSFIWNDIRRHCDGKISDMLEFVDIVPVPLTESLGTITGKYPARDKITSSAVDLLGEESIQRLLHITDTNNPYRFDLRRGALARVAGGGIHFSDEMFKNKKDLVQVYLGVIQNRTIEMDGFKWPIDTMIIATSNNSEFNRFLAEKEEAPIIDRCRISYISHNTNYRRQEELTAYAIGSETKTTLSRDKLHQDPNLNYAASVSVILTRLPHSEKLTPIETMKLAAGVLHVRLRRVRHHRARHPGLRERRQRPRQVPGRPENRARPVSRAHHDRDVQRLHGRAPGHPQGCHELCEHDHRHRRGAPGSGQDVEVQGSSDRRVEGPEGGRTLHQEHRRAPAVEDGRAARNLPHLHPQDLRSEPEAVRPDDRHHAQQAGVLPDLRSENHRVFLHAGG